MLNKLYPLPRPSLRLALTLLLIGLPLTCQAGATDLLFDSAQTFSSVAQAFKLGFSTYAERLLDAAERLFWLTFSLVLVYEGAKLIFRHDSMEVFTATLVRLTLLTGLFYFLLLNGPAIGASVIDSFTSIADRQDRGPAEIFSTSLNLAVTFFDTISNSGLNIFSKFLLSLPCLYFFYLITSVVTRYGLLYLAAYGLCFCGVFALGFGSMPFTRNIAVNYLKAIISVAVQLMVTIIICNVGFELLETLLSSVKILEREITLQDCLLIVFTGMFIQALSFQLPPLIGNLVEGGRLEHSPKTPVLGSALRTLSYVRTLTRPAPSGKGRV
ncbi:MAG: type IV secretion system protein [Succinivibrio sp.]|nr:type IV secretion system protein [Succinivibrio sp.]